MPTPRVCAAVCYLYALGIDEASFVTPFYQTVPIFAYFLGYFVLGETITLLCATESSGWALLEAIAPVLIITASPALAS